jgi:hypothetical protein
MGERCQRRSTGSRATGGVISETLRAFTEDEYRQMAAALPPGH